MDWADLFERAEPHRTDVDAMRETLAARRSDGDRKAPGEGPNAGRGEDRDG